MKKVMTVFRNMKKKSSSSVTWPSEIGQKFVSAKLFAPIKILNDQVAPRSKVTKLEAKFGAYKLSYWAQTVVKYRISSRFSICWGIITVNSILKIYIRMVVHFCMIVKFLRNNARTIFYGRHFLAVVTHFPWDIRYE